MSEEEYPLVSAIMLAGRVPSKDILVTIDCFKAQTYPNKELIIVNNCTSQFDATDLNIYAQKNVFVMDTPVLLTAGMARNYGLTAANGRIIAQFDPDYYHAPKRIEAQLSAIAQHEVNVCLLTETLSYSLVSGKARHNRNTRNAIFNSMVYIRPKGIDYPDQEKAEERTLLEKFAKAGAKVISLAEPSLMVKIYTTAGARKFDRTFSNEFDIHESAILGSTVDAYEALEQ